VQFNIVELHAIYTHKKVHRQKLHQLLNTKAFVQVSAPIRNHQKCTALFYSITNRLLFV